MSFRRDLCFSLTSDYVQRKRRFRRGGTNSTLSILRKELRDGNLQSLIAGSSCFVSASNTEPDPWLSSFICNPPVDDNQTSVQPHSSAEASSVKQSPLEDVSERYELSYLVLYYFL